MFFHYTIKPTADFEQVADTVMQRAQADEAILVLPRGERAATLIFCVDAAGVERQRRRVETGGTVSQVYGAIEVWRDDGFLGVDQACGEEAYRQIEGFVRWVLETQGACGVVDEDGHCDITERVARDVGVLFRRS